jgi:BlaI family transcriptional regulator, penicillinase repressor
MTSKETNLSPSELKIMKIIWNEGTSASRDIAEIAKQKWGWSGSTTKTLLSRLVQKNYLQTTQVGNSYLYTPKKEAIRILEGIADDFIKDPVIGTSGPIVAYMIRHSDFSSEDIAQLRTMLDMHEQKDDEK